MANMFTVKEKIGGKDYTFQFNGIAEALRAVDNSYIENSTNISSVKLGKYLLENVVVEPKGLTPDDFDTMEEYNEVIAFARDVMQGNFREKSIESTANKKG